MSTARNACLGCTVLFGVILFLSVFFDQIQPIQDERDRLTLESCKTLSFNYTSYPCAYARDDDKCVSSSAHPRCDDLAAVRPRVQGPCVHNSNCCRYRRQSCTGSGENRRCQYHCVSYGNDLGYLFWGTCRDIHIQYEWTTDPQELLRHVSYVCGFNDEACLQSYIKAFPVGKERACYYDPKHQEINFDGPRSFGPWWGLAGFAIACMVLGVIVAACIKYSGKNPFKRKTSILPGETGLSDDPGV